ncbi:hypothetical protein MYP_3123 [Sporocytophaga myxococcoides]|uniref:Glyoxalase/fosfomycin resistance/dioxygenase domain-containing protein n=1 Tax=Sporocytophaga myxococcoides TaxID=153721 RepID=A0A098LHH5_9BACT|nr:VOC family protein [Sporocytophaga myxococcoides]GAL85894.1 hypothetical protein MYP_3123 [Sporocytophaga myxococcoides]
MSAIHSYLTFNGTCENAFNFYKSVFGGDFPAIMRFKDVPSEHPFPESAKEQIMHMTLPIGKNSILMGSDSPEVFGGDPVVQGNNFSVAIVAESEEEARRLFNGLSEGGKVTMPLEKAFWGAYFGMFTDKFGIHWMVNYDYENNK